MPLELSLREKLILSLYQAAVGQAGEVFIPRAPAATAKGFRAQCYALKKKVQSRAAGPKSDGEAREMAELVDAVTLHVEQHPEKGWGVMVRKKGVEAELEKLLEEVTGGTPSPSPLTLVSPRSPKESPQVAQELDSMAERIRRATAEADDALLTGTVDPKSKYFGGE